MTLDWLTTDWFAIDWAAMEWSRMVPEFLGKAGGVIAGFAVSWFVLARKRLKALEKAQRGDSDDLIFQAHFLLPTGDDDADPDDRVLVFRNVAPKTTVNDLYDNLAVRERVRELAEQTTLATPILQTRGALGFELLNDALGHVAGLLALSAAPRQTWLFAMTCEDRQVVRKQCVRCFLIRGDDLDRFADWHWCLRHVRVESPWHWFRVVALHQIAIERQREERDFARPTEPSAMPLVDPQHRHRRIRPVSVGIHGGETPVGRPQTIDWAGKIDELKALGLELQPTPVEDRTAADAEQPRSS